jgi:hypothetical protein
VWLALSHGHALAGVTSDVLRRHIAEAFNQARRPAARRAAMWESEGGAHAQVHLEMLIHGNVAVDEAVSLANSVRWRRWRRGGGTERLTEASRACSSLTSS